MSRQISADWQFAATSGARMHTTMGSIDPACLTGDVSFTLTPVGGSALAPVVVANTRLSTFVSTIIAVASGIFEVDVDFDPTNPYCNPSSDAAVLTVVAPGASSTGGGWYRVDGFSPSRVNFGYTIQKPYNRKTDVTTYRGQLLWMNSSTWRLKGSMYSTGSPAAYGTFACPSFVGVPSTSTRCAARSPAVASSRCGIPPPTAGSVTGWPRPTAP